MTSLASRARPYFGAVVLSCALLTVGGIYSAIRMPSGVYPEVTFPRIAVVAKVPDRDVANMEANFTHMLEVAVGDVEVVCRPDYLLAHGLSAADLADQIGQLTPFQPVGVVEGQPAAFQIIVDTLPRRAAEIEDLIISTRRDQPVRVRDVADVKV